VTTASGISVSTVPRTLFDLAAVASVDEVESALRESEYLRLHDRLSLPDLLARYPGHRGCRKVRACLARRAEGPGRFRSPLEERFLPFLRRHRLPMPQLNAWIEIGEHRYQVDCLWPQAKLVIELDGYESHGTKIAFREDRRHPPPLLGDGGMPHRVHPRMHPVEPPGPKPPPDRPRLKPQLNQLPPRNNPMLPPSELGDPNLRQPRPHLCPHIGRGCGLGGHPTQAARCGRAVGARFVPSVPETSPEAPVRLVGPCG